MSNDLTQAQWLPALQRKEEMSLIDGREIKMYVLDAHDIYHPEHPLHHLILADLELEEEMWEAALSEMEHN